MSIRIRMAEAADLPAIAKVHVDTWRTTYRGMLPDQYLADLRYERREQMWTGVLSEPGKALMVAESGSRIVGFACCGKLRDSIESFNAEIFAIYLDQAFQKQGIGSRLVLACAEWLLSNGYRAMALWVVDQNPSRRFYEKIGGRPLGISKELDFGGAKTLDVAYGWNSLSELRDRLQYAIETGSISGS